MRRNKEFLCYGSDLSGLPKKTRNGEKRSAPDFISSTATSPILHPAVQQRGSRKQQQACTTQPSHPAAPLHLSPAGYIV